MAVRVEVISEEGTSSDPARILVYDNDCLVTEVVGTIEPKQGADGWYYPCVTLERKGVSTP